MYLRTLTGYLLYTHDMILVLTLSFCKLFRLILLNYHIRFKFSLYINKIKTLTGNVISVGILIVKTAMLAIFTCVLTSCMCRVLINVHTDFLVKLSALKH